MLAMPMSEVPHAFAARVRRLADADVVARADARSVHGESSASNFAGNLAECVVARFSLRGDGERGDAPPIRRMHEPNGSRNQCRHSGFSVPRGR